MNDDNYEPDTFTEPDWVCDECGQPCSTVEVVFSYSGTHCTYGKSGTHHTGQYESECCGSDFHEA